MVVNIDHQSDGYYGYDMRDQLQATNILKSLVGWIAYVDTDYVSNVFFQFQPFR